ncbi:hypothetical protein SC499_23790, partial [Peribacillus simplex]|uniref:hypothetical protein n=1 Tax=Peribacillus simplex TaxID=1478 RepID=UPI00298EC1F5
MSLADKSFGSRDSRRMDGFLKKRTGGYSGWYYPLQVDRVKREHDKMFLTVYLRGDFSMAKKGQTFQTYTEE